MVELQPITIFLGFISGICWTYVYIAIIRRGMKEKVCGMPLWALCLNISWEFIFSFIFPSSQLFQEIVNICWFCMDVAIIYLYLRHEKNRINEKLRGKLFYFHFSLVLATCFFAVLVFPLQFNRTDGGFAAFLQNVVMSVLFIYMFLERGILGQSWKIAIAKLFGTLAPTIAVFVEEPNSPLLIFGGFFSLIFDMVYLLLMLKAKTISRETLDKKRNPTY